MISRTQTQEHPLRIREEMKKKLQTTQRRMMRMMIQTKRQTGKSHEAARAASVDATNDDVRHEPDSDKGDDTTEHNNQDLDEHEESSPDTDSSPCFDDTSEDDPEDELGAWVDFNNESSAQKRTTCKQQAESRRGSSFLEAGKG